MDFGQVSQELLRNPNLLKQIHWGDPNRCDPRLSSVLKGEASDAFQIQIGLPIWGCPEWVGSVYPLKTSPKDFLKEYAKQFQSIELNSTFYQIPTIETLKRWDQETSPDFRFFVKIHQSISHEPDLAESYRQSETMIQRLSNIQNKIGACFLQLPPAFGPDRHLELWSRLQPWFQSSIPTAIEFRHPGWFHDGYLIGRAFQKMQECGIGTVITDTAGRRDVAHVTLTAPFVVIRFLGNEPDASDFHRFEHWAERLEIWKSKGLENAAFFLHQSNNAHAPNRIPEFVDAFNRKMGLDLRSWQSHSLFSM